jgi:hypothetical protein
VVDRRPSFIGGARARACGSGTGALNAFAVNASPTAYKDGSIRQSFAQPSARHRYFQSAREQAFDLAAQKGIPMRVARFGVPGIAFGAAVGAVVVAVVGACASSTGAAHAAEPIAPHGLTLVHRFTLPADLGWGSVSVSLTPSAWRVGHANGPVATEAQLRTVLANLAGVDIGARCTGWVDGGTSYPCSYAVTDIDFAGVVNEHSGALSADWRASADWGTSAEPHPRPTGTDSLVVHAPGAIAAVLDAPRFVAVRVPLRYLGNSAGTFGSKLDFRIRAVSNPLVPSRFDRDSGAVILRGGHRNSATQLTV